MRAVPTIEFCANELGPAVTAEAPGGGPLLDICDEAHAPVPFSCRTASCGTCRVEVSRGAELLHAARADEREVLSIFAAPASHRLACQAILRPLPGVITLRSVGADE
jgi:ferredoxin